MVLYRASSADPLPPWAVAEAVNPLYTFVYIIGQRSTEPPPPRLSGNCLSWAGTLPYRVGEPRMTASAGGSEAVSASRVSPACGFTVLTRYCRVT